MNNNKVTLCGNITEVNPAFVSKSGDVCTLCKMSIERLSGTRDELDVIITDKIAPNDYLVKVCKENGKLTIYGEIRSANYMAGEKRKLRIYVHASSISEESPDELPCHAITLTGHICRKPEYRHTPLGKVVTDLMISHNPDGKKISHYVPCIAWGNTGLSLTRLDVGTKINIDGRIQSREFTKIIDNDTIVFTAIEVSVNSYEVIKNEQQKY